jgi:D-arabinose 1-dehydrogenase-like Zn-dependent alcohol dehydrogenase
MNTATPTTQARAYAAQSASSPLAPASISRRAPTDRDVQIEILFCGVCHSDVHQVRNEWSAIPTVYPIVPGHEIVGRVTQVGSAVTKYQPGEVVGVGCLVDSDHTCPKCRVNLEQLCPNSVFTYNSPDKHGTAPVTYGGYSSSIVGAPEKPMPVAAFALIFGRRNLAGSLIGGIAETQEMLDFCGEHNITSDVEVIPIQKVNEAYERLVRSDVKYRFCIDMASLKG